MQKNNSIARLIWEKYKFYKKGREVVRSGFGLCGAYSSGYTDGMRRDAATIETILEHQAATTALAAMILRLYPGILPDDTHCHLLELMLFHDVVEVESGDLADDGHLDKVKKAERERQAMQDFAGGVWGVNDLPYSFELLERTDGRPMLVAEHDDNALFGQLAYMIDKTEAILQLAFFELNGVKPNLDYKVEHFGGITDRDKFYQLITGSSYSLDVWAAHFYDFAKSYKEFWLFRAIIETAYQEVRGCHPRWIDKILANCETRLWPIEKD